MTRRGELPSRAWAAQAERVAAELGVDPAVGLGAEEVHRRLARFGENRLREPEPRSAVEILVAQLRSFVVLLLLVAAAVSFAFEQRLEGFAILGVVVINTLLGFFTELRAVRSMEALRELGDRVTTVRRGGEIVRVPARSLVPGDVLVVEGGDVITADARLVVASRVAADESLLTGESVPVDKGVAPVAADASLGERSSMLHKGTGLTRGSAEAVVVGTGTATEIGRVASLVFEIPDEETPLEKTLRRLGVTLAWVSFAFAAVVGALGIAAGRPLVEVVETAIALAVATVPEGLPVVATMALARGMWRMAKENALVERLSAVETLGSTSVVLTDKTGTLTENVMQVASVAFETEDVAMGEVHARTSDARVRGVLEAIVICNDASFGEDDAGIGDPMEVALLRAGREGGIERDALLAELPEVREEAFDPEVQMMATVHREGDGFRFVVKGAPERVLAACARARESETEVALDDARRERILARSEALARGGQRVLAVACKASRDAMEHPYESLAFLGLVGLVDPPREEVRGAIEACRRAGVRIAMVTGDQPATARYVARAVHLVDDEEPETVDARSLSSVESLPKEDKDRLAAAAVVARATPKQKLDLIAIHREAGHVVAMLGDGVNDAPALRAADIGVAMGKRGTAVARQAADMVLEDDQLMTIVVAIREGRIIFDNIRKFVVYLLSCNLSEILAVGIAAAVGAILPLTALQILFLNLVTDVFPALALAGGEGDEAVMSRPPRARDEPVLTRRHFAYVAGYGVLLTASVLGALAVARLGFSMEARDAVTISFLVMGFGQLAHVFNMASPRSGAFVNEVTKNAAVWGAVALCTALLLLTLYLPPLSALLHTSAPSTMGWLLVAVFSLAPLVVGRVASLGARAAMRADERRGAGRFGSKSGAAVE